MHRPRCWMKLPEMLRSILPIGRPKPITMRPLAAAGEACGAAAAGAVAAIAVADLLTSGDEEISGNAAAPSAAAMPSFRKLLRAGSSMVIAVSPYSPPLVFMYSNDGPCSWPKRSRSGRQDYL